MSSPAFPRLAVVALIALTLNLGVDCGVGPGSNEPVGHHTFTSPQSNPIALDGDTLYVANTTSNLLDVVDTTINSVVAQIEVGLEPVSVAVRPGADEVWVSNHVSDSVSVIDTNPASDTFRSVVATIHDLDANGVTQFDEPVGIAFTSDGSKAYVALSSRNDIAVVDANSRSITKRVHISAQEPRAIAVRGNRLYVAAFESFNQSELSVCPDPDETQGAPQCTLDFNDVIDFVLESPNIPGADHRIVFDTDVPDRDLYVFDTTDESEVDVVSGVGTLLYGLVVDGSGEVFITQTDARNEVNGDNGDNLIDLENRLFLNQIARVDCSGASCGGPALIELEPLPPADPAPGDELATPFGIALSDDDSTLVATAMGTSRVFTVRTSDGVILDKLDLNDGLGAGFPDFGQQIPKGVVLRSDGTGKPQTAYVLNTLENTVSVVSVAGQSGTLSHVAKIAIGNDPTPDAVRRGRIAFNNAFAATSGTFSCESCHPDGNTDQLLWRIGGACFFGPCSGDDEIRSTMPVRGLKNTLPLHWDGSLGDPFGGPNGAVGTGGSESAQCSLGGPDGDHDCFLHLVGESLSGVMCEQQGGCNNGPSGDPGELSTQERDDMAVFLASVSYPPARARPVDDLVSPVGLAGFSDFFVQQPNALGPLLDVSTCADMSAGCHALPLGVDHNSSTLGAFDVPTMRGLNDRTLQFSIGITNNEETLLFADQGECLVLFGFPVCLPLAEFPWDPVQGFEEEVTLAAAFIIFGPVYGATAGNTFQMVDEASTGYSGALGRQLTLNQATTAPGPALAASEALLDHLEAADQRGQVNLRAVGRVSNGGGPFTPVTLSYRTPTDDYRGTGAVAFTRQQLIDAADAGDMVVTLTGALRQNVAEDAAMPLLTLTTTDSGPTGNPALPFLTSNGAITLVGIDVEEGAQVVLDGAVDAGASLICLAGATGGICDPGNVEITLSALPSPNGLHLLQVQNDAGLLSPELPICIGSVAACR